MQDFERKTFGERDTLRGVTDGAPWQAAEGLTIGDLETLRDEGVVLAGRYKVIRRLGEGGMGSVWLAEDSKLDNRKVAVKMLPAVLAGKKGAYKQVKAEAAVAMKLSHSNIATVRAFEEDEGGSPFLVMDYIEGEGLDEILAERGPLGEEETRRVLGPVAAALDYAHSQGVVHRDVKPGNVMVRKDGVPFVLDFGIAREVQETLTRVTGKLSSGTLVYMSPEQLHGRSPKAAQDVYSFAAMAYECLAGEPPFSRGQIEWQIDHDSPEPLGESVASQGLRDGIMAGLAKEPERRPGSCAGVLGGEGGGQRGEVEGQRSKVEGQRVEGGGQRVEGGGRGVWRWVVAAVLAAGVGVGVWEWQGRDIAGETSALPGETRQDAASPEEEAAAKAEEEERLAAQRAAEEKAARLEAERVRAEREERILQESEELEETVYRLAPMAKTKAGNAEGMGYDRGQGFGERLDEMREKLAQGEEAVKGRNFGKAKEWFEGSMAAAAWCEENAPLRDAAARARDAAAGKKSGAEAMDGAHLGLTAWNKAEKARAAAEGAFAEARFKEATAGWNAAGTAYGESESAARKAKAEQGLEAARGAKRRGAWEECLAAAEGVLAVAAGNAEAKALKGEAQQVLDDARRAAEEAKRKAEEEAAARRREAERAAEEKRKAAEALAARPEDSSQREGTRAGERRTVRVGSQEVALRWCPAGTFTMGSPLNEEGRFIDETQHRVTLSKGFWMGETEVTQGLWEAVTGSNPSAFKGDNLPVVQVSWEDCETFVKALNERYGQAGMRWALPTEAQWEYACRAGSTGPYAGTGRLEDMGWYTGNSGNQTHPVGTKQPNAWGLYDMHGNVWEWCADRYGDYPSGSVTDPPEAQSGWFCVYRGGSWSSLARVCRSARRCRSVPHLRDRSLGLRVALLPVP